MSAANQGPSQQPPPAWTEPPWSGWIETTGDALLILEAARRGLIPRVTRRLVDAERKMITSGSVFVFDEDESGIKRWTDGLFWSPSRILGNFLLYRETDKRGNRNARADPEEPDVLKPDSTGTLSRPKSDVAAVGIDKHRERTLLGSLTNSYKFKPDGLMKKTFSLTIGGVAQHLISYYKIEDVENGRLRSPSSLPELASLEISAEYLDKTHFRNPPKVEIGTDGVLRYRGEGDELDSPSSNPPAPSLVLEPSSHNKRPPGRRSAPYQGRPPPRKRSKHPDQPVASSSTTPAPAEAASGTIVLTTPQTSTSSIPPAPSAPLYSPDPNATQVASTYPPQYPYFPSSHPPPAYPPHVNAPMYSQPGYPPPVPQPGPGVMNSQHLPQYGYPAYPPHMGPPGQPPQVSPPVQDSSRSPTTVPYYYPSQPHPPYAPYNSGPPAHPGWYSGPPPASGYQPHQPPPPPLPQAPIAAQQQVPPASSSPGAITPTTEQK